MIFNLKPLGNRGYANGYLLKTVSKEFYLIYFSIFLWPAHLILLVVYHKVLEQKFISNFIKKIHQHIITKIHQHNKNPSAYHNIL
jgi:hypothetical protein